MKVLPFKQPTKETKETKEQERLQRIRSSLERINSLMLAMREAQRETSKRSKL